MLDRLYGAIPRLVLTTNTTKAAMAIAATMVAGLAFDARMSALRPRARVRLLQRRRHCSGIER